MKEYFGITKGSVIAFFFSFTCIIPMLGPGFFAAVMARENHYSNKKFFSKKPKTKTLISMSIGIIFFCFMVNRQDIDYFLLITPLNLMALFFGYFIGDAMEKRKILKVMKES